MPSALEFPTQDIVVLRSSWNEDRTESAVLFIPDDARAFLYKRIDDYGISGIDNRRPPTADRFEVVETIEAATAETLFVGELDLTAPDIVWWELWVRQAGARVDGLAELARGANLDVHADRLVFPTRQSCSFTLPSAH